VSSAPTTSALEQRAEKGLELALKLTGADSAFLLLCSAGSSPPLRGRVSSRSAPARALASPGKAGPDSELMAWAQQRLYDVDAATLDDTAGSVPARDSELRLVGDIRYCVVPLWSDDEHDRLGGVGVVLGWQRNPPRYPTREAVRAIADELVDG
jgi:hypothetical protein